jgi:hypothetical protein
MKITLLIAWTWVALPLGWGVYQSVQKSLPLFQGESTQDSTNDVNTTATRPGA